MSEWGIAGAGAARSELGRNVWPAALFRHRLDRMIVGWASQVIRNMLPFAHGMMIGRLVAMEAPQYHSPLVRQVKNRLKDSSGRLTGACFRTLSAITFPPKKRVNRSFHSRDITRFFGSIPKLGIAQSSRPPRI